MHICRRKLLVLFTPFLSYYGTKIYTCLHVNSYMHIDRICNDLSVCFREKNTYIEFMDQHVCYGWSALGFDLGAWLGPTSLLFSQLKKKKPNERRNESIIVIVDALAGFVNFPVMCLILFWNDHHFLVAVIALWPKPKFSCKFRSCTDVQWEQTWI